MTKPITPEMIAAWRTLQRFVRSARADESLPEFCYEASDAIDVLDNSGFMVLVEDAEPGQTFSTPRCRHCSNPMDDEGGDLATGEPFCGANPASDKHEAEPRLGPAEWGDTTRADMARRQGITGE